jgi:hypothetical protein
MASGAIPGALTTFRLTPSDFLPLAVFSAAMVTVFATETSVFEICAWIFQEFTKVVGRDDPFQRTSDRLVNSLPLTVRTKAFVPAVTDDGEMLLMYGVPAKTGEQAMDTPRAPSRRRDLLRITTTSI